MTSETSYERLFLKEAGLADAELGIMSCLDGAVLHTTELIRDSDQESSILAYGTADPLADAAIQAGFVPKIAANTDRPHPKGD